MAGYLRLGVNIDHVATLRQAQLATTLSLSVFLKDVGRGLLEVAHNTLALVGLAVVSVLLVFTSQAGVREKVESATLGWLHARHESPGVFRSGQRRGF